MTYESLLLVGVVFAATLPFAVLTQTRNALDNRHALQAFLFVVLGIYFTWFWRKGQTLAMKTWHLRLQRSDGNALDWPTAMARYLLAWVWVLPPAIFGWLCSLGLWGLTLATVVWLFAWSGLAHMRGDRQYWHDIACGTRLVYLPPDAGTSTNSGSSQPS